MNSKLSVPHHFLKKRAILILLAAASLVSLILTPISEVEKNITDNLPWVGLGTLFTEALFIIGLGIMALEAGHELGKNPLRWRKRLHRVIAQLVRTRFFWLGFWINAAGAVGTALVVSAGIIKSLPAQSWGLLWLPAADLGLTIAIRVAAITAAEEAK